ncbi:MAG: winged helix-turn-helix transcriptional regulator [Nanoarchaeota archaeon]|jgi:DNA-binding Lrp family transcriptional regulator|nr:winged helix-turn-helix transcriptional regulator [Nanoarchaeota archaeon]
MKIDIKDRKILYELEKNSRLTNSQIGKSVGLGRDSVGYRIKQLEGKGIIRGYKAVINTSKLDYDFFRVYFKLMDLKKGDLEKIIGFLKKDKRAWWIAKLEGSWDLVFAFFAKTNKEFYDFQFQLLENFRSNIKESLISPIIYYREMPRRYLTNSRENFKIDVSDPIIKMDDKDFKILRILSKNGRIMMIDLAKALKLDIKTIKSRIKKLESEKIILGYNTDVDVSKLGRDFYTVQISLNNYSRFDSVRNYVQSLVESTSWVISIGGADLEFDLEIENSNRYYEIIDKLRSKFPEIREIRYFRIRENYKINYMPEE